MVLKISGGLAGSLALAFLVLTLSTAAYSQPTVVDETLIQAHSVSEGDSSVSRSAGTTSADEGLKSEVKETVDGPVTAPPNGFRSVSFRSEETDEAKALDKMRADLTAAKKQANSGWQFSFAPYLYATGMHGTVAARGREIEVDMSFGDVMSNFDLGLMGAFEARKGKFSLFSDLMWIKLSDEEETPGGLYNTAKIGVNIFIFDPELGYQLAGSDKGVLDVVGGVRIWSVETNINVTSGLLPGFDVSQRKSWAAPVFGLRGSYDLTPKFYLSSKFDLGGFGIGADFTTQFYGGVGYRITKNIALVGGYRYLMVDYDDEEGFLFDTNMNGFLFGAKFTF